MSQSSNYDSCFVFCNPRFDIWPKGQLFWFKLFVCESLQNMDVSIQIFPNSPLTVFLIQYSWESTVI
jgi:hypothetical protein